MRKKTKCDDIGKVKKKALTGSLKTCCFVTDFELPEIFANWGDAIGAVVKARNEGLTPDEVQPETWQIFETVAFLLIPKVNRYVKVNDVTVEILVRHFLFQF